MTSRGRRQRLVGWLAVGAQALVIIGLVLGPGDWFPGPVWVTALGVGLVGLGGVIALAGVATLGAALTPTPVPVEDAGLRTGGLYRFVRHPIYSGVLLGCLGVALCGLSVWRLAWWVALLAVLTTKSVWEERMLAAEYADYAAYARRTGRFVPRLRP